ncbi:MAG: sterol desaturase family protein [Desulfomonilaceae bacterium]|nr:sterol desaturase family protein [Desulfomonilaceae bacterium]
MKRAPREGVNLMDDLVIKNEAALRLGFFLGIFAVVAVAEAAAPRRALAVSKAGRWFANMSIVVINTVLVRLIVPAGAVGMAAWVSHRGWGLLNNVDMPYWLAVVISVIVLDFVIYMQHVMFHAVPTLWRFHMMHHADLDFDVTTGTRFHPVEILLSMGIKAAAIAVLGPPVLGVVAFEILLNGTAMFNHGNLKLPLALDRVLRLFVVTPDMHRVHHSVFPTEANSNFGFNLPWWDRTMGTYRAQPMKGHEYMTIGLNQYRDPARLTLRWMLAMPFVGVLGNYPLNRRGRTGSDG